MRCEECLPLVEEYFDGELEGRAAESVGAHLGSCAECSAAHAALSAEQDLYLRYDRGVEVGPALWQNVRAEIARAEPTEARAFVAAPPSFASRLRGLLAAASAPVSPRSAYASSLALLVLGVTIGALWYANAPRTGQSEMAATDGGPESAAVMPTGARPAGGVGNPGDENAKDIDESTTREEHKATADSSPPPRYSTEGRARRERVRGEVTAPAVPAVEAAAARVPDADHLDGAEVSAVIQAANYDDDPVADAARLLDPEEKAVASHVERAQMLLRSFKNTRSAGDATTVNVAYEKDLSRRLLEENAALQLEAEAGGDKRTRRVLDAIQPYLLDIANMRDDSSREEVRSIKERMRKTEIVAALQVY